MMKLRIESRLKEGFKHLLREKNQIRNNQSETSSFEDIQQAEELGISVGKLKLIAIAMFRRRINFRSSRRNECSRFNCHCKSSTERNQVI